MSVDKWEQRMLCPDGACVGVISMNGTCKVCGTAVPDWGDPRKPGRVSSKAEADELENEPEHVADEDDEAGEDGEDGEDKAKAPDDEANDDDITKRKLCADGTCVGVLGADGHCKVCGKAADGSLSEEDDDDEDEYEDDEGDDDDDDADDGDADADHAVEAVTNGAKKPAAKKPDDDEDRALCPDGACVGVIGDNGKCKICGKDAE